MASTLASNSPPVQDPDRDFPMTEEDFRRIAAKVEAMAGIVLKDHKRQMVYTRLSRRLRALGLPSFRAYLDHLESPTGANEIGEFANAVTTNLTSFYREGHHFTHLGEKILRPLVERGERRVRIWSAGCSSGEEPYTISMTVQGVPGLTSGRDVKILATDLDTNVLAKGARGEYDRDRLKGIPEDKLRASTEAIEGGARFKPALRGLITFRQLNLLHDWPFKGPFDAIFCRNVVIYFDAATKGRLVDRFAAMLKPDGALYLGHSESLLGEHPLLRSEGRTIYRRRA